MKLHNNERVRICNTESQYNGEYVTIVKPSPISGIYLVRHGKRTFYLNEKSCTPIPIQNLLGLLE